ncbi:hypothetical protein C8A05DRAFT_17267 [Staphylotrichum tortipilum]|uniref:Uncharacterized protein n=1 Tax=Staphylotrichum tortipilum TaxID=2831512 RepID=A0AAN6MGH7_9PEZI|nr:hypothetical protein C8A05DRAFT_17267 [Staphylotrichum longicolle]
MLPKLPFFFAAGSWLGSTSLAAPAIDIPAALAPRQTACPTTTRPAAWAFSTMWLATTTLTNGWSSLGSVTSTNTESQTRTITTWATVTSPAVATLPATTTITYTATVTTTNTYELFYETVTSPDHAPASDCILTTVTHILPTTSSITYTQPLSYLPPFSTYPLCTILFEVGVD